jgi:hypothetical protein
MGQNSDVSAQHSAREDARHWFAVAHGGLAVDEDLPDAFRILARFFRGGEQLLLFDVLVDGVGEVFWRGAESEGLDALFARVVTAGSSPTDRSPSSARCTKSSDSSYSQPGKKRSPSMKLPV